jgi:hypothetical protein
MKEKKERNIISNHKRSASKNMESIRTERLKNLTPMKIRDFHFDGEEWE